MQAPGKERLRWAIVKDTADAEVVERLAAQDQDALREVIAKHGGVVYGMARRVVGEPTLAEEIAQDTFFALWRRPHAFDPERGALQTFLLGVARNKAIDLVRREETLKRTKETLLAEAQAASGNSARYGQMDGVDQRLVVLEAVAQLTPVQRESIVLAYFGGRTYREVARELDIPEGTAKTRLRDGLMKLRELLNSRQEEV